MKKLLFVTALLAMGTMAMGVDPSSGAESKAEVLVKAEIVDDFFKITDIDGNPLVLDFKRLPKMDYSKNIAKASVEYKVTASTKIENVSGITLGMTLTSFETPESKVEDTPIDTKVNFVNIINENVTAANGPVPDADKIKVNLGLDANEKTMKKDQSVVVGKITGTINSNLTTNNTGDYSGKVFLVATVKQ